MVTCKKDPHGSHGFCLLNNIAIAGAYAVNRYRHEGQLPVLKVDLPKTLERMTLKVPVMPRSSVTKCLVCLSLF